MGGERPVFSRDSCPTWIPASDRYWPTRRHRVCWLRSIRVLRAPMRTPFCGDKCGVRPAKTATCVRAGCFPIGNTNACAVLRNAAKAVLIVSGEVKPLNFFLERGKTWRLPGSVMSHSLPPRDEVSVTTTARKC